MDVRCSFSFELLNENLQIFAYEYWSLHTLAVLQQVTTSKRGGRGGGFRGSKCFFFIRDNKCVMQKK
jgi:hypothetical protein